MTVRCLAVLAAAVLPFLTLAARAQESPEFPAPILKQADPNEKGDGTLGPAAKAAIVHGPLPFSDADVAAKTAADRERDEAEKETGRQRPFSPATPIGTLQIVGGFNNPGLPGGLFAPTPLIRPVRSGPHAIFSSCTVRPYYSRQRQVLESSIAPAEPRSARDR